MAKTMKFHAFDDKPPIVYRPGTSDEAIINAVIVNQQEYLFPTFKPEIVFDIGGNIGVVAVVLANIYPSAKIYSFEPIKENFELLKENVSHYPNITALEYGLGGFNEMRKIYKSTDSTNLGGFSQYIKDGELAGEFQLRNMREVCQEFGVPEVIKIDVEGAEGEIISSMNPKQLDQVRWITGELHGVNDYVLLDYLNERFHLQHSRGFADKVWHFHAKSRSWLAPSPDQPPQA